MFSPLRISILFIVSVLLTVALSYLDTDTPNDTFGQTAAFTTLVVGVVTILYASAYGLTRTLMRYKS